MIGYKSLFGIYKVHDLRTGDTVKITVQANKNYGVCDVVFPEPCKPKRPLDMSNVETREAYKSADQAYKEIKEELKAKRQYFLNQYQGCQVNRSGFDDEMAEFLFNLWNS